MRHKTLKIVSIGVMSAMLLVGCGGSSSSTTDSNTNAETNAGNVNNEASNQENDNKTYGQITAIDGSTITVALGTMKNRGNRGDGSGQTMPSGKPDMPQGSDNANAPEAPTGSDNANAPEAPTGSNDANKKGGQGFSMLDLTGETATISVSDSTKISIKSRTESTDGTISDLQVGDTISFELSDDNKTATTITSQSMGGKGGQGGQKPSTDASQAPAATAKAS
ncbi:MAG: hypothetical protein Q4G58_06350 [bacterium]|nr:hypothetical protein [bacterium]